MMISAASFLIIAGSGVLAGFLTGLVSLGGAFIVVPAVYHALLAIGVSSHAAFTSAVATSVAFVLISSSSAASVYARKLLIDYRLVAIISLGAIFGVWMGINTLMQTDDALIRKSFGVFILTMGAYILASKHFKWGQAYAGQAPRYTWFNQSMLFAIGIAVGFLVSVFGIGGGGVIAPAVALLARADMKRAIATGVAATVVISIYGAGGYIISGYGHVDTVAPSLGWVYLPAIALLIPCALLSAPFGAKLAMRLSQPVLLLILAATMFLMGIKFLFF